MKRAICHRYLPAALLLAAFTLLFSCAPVEKPLRTPTWVPDQMAVLPFIYVPAEPGKGLSARSPLTGAVFSTGEEKAPPHAGTLLDEALAAELAKVVDLKLIPAAQAGRVYLRLDQEQLGASARELVAETGRKLNAQAVLVGYFYRFEDRVGGPLAASRPAGLCLELALLRVRDQAVLWKNSFDERQRSLSEDILELDQFVEHGLRWLTIEEWAHIGMSRLLRRFPWRKPASEPAPSAQ